MDETSRRQLAARWTHGDGPAVANEVFARLGDGRGLNDLPLGEIDGRADLRGISVPTPTASRPRTYTIKVGDDIEFTQNWVTLDGVIEFKGIELRNLDLSGGHLPHLRFSTAGS